MEINKYKNLRLFIVGCGSIGDRHANVLVSLGIRSLILYDKNTEASAKLMDQISGKADIEVVSSYEEGLSKSPDAVYILTPTALHIDMACLAIEAGCHVFIEKPLSNSRNGVDRLKRLSEANSKKVMVGFCFRYHPGIVKAKEYADDGHIGKVVSVRALMGEHFPDVRPDYLNTYYVKYSGAFELIHDLDLAIWFAGSNIKRYYGVFGSFADIGFKSPDTVEILLEFEKGITGSVHLDFFQSPRRRQFEIMGTQGTIVIEFAKWDKYTVSIFTRRDGEWRSAEYSTERNVMFEKENIDFLDSILENSEFSSTVQEAEKSLEVFCGLYVDRQSY